MLEKWMISLLLLALCLVWTPALADTAPALGGLIPDFTAETTSGDEGPYILSEKLAEKPFALIAFWDAAAPDGQALIAFLDALARERWEEMTVITLAEGEEDPWLSEEYDFFLSAYLGWDEGGRILAAAGGGELPLLVLADDGGRAVYIRQGALTEEELAGAAPMEIAFAALDQYGEPVPGTAAQFCTDEFCRLVRADETGRAFFTGAPAAYHLQLLKAPEGYAAASQAEAPLPPLSGDVAMILDREE